MSTLARPHEPASNAKHTNADALLTADDVAALLRVPKSWVYAETRAGRLPHVALGPRYRRYRRDVIEAWIAERERGPRSSCQPEGSPHA